MAHNQTGIAIVIKAFLPTGKSLDEAYAALSLVKTAHETSDYAALLAAAQIDSVKTEQKNRRVEDAPVPVEPGPMVAMMTGEAEPPFQSRRINDDALAGLAAREAAISTGEERVDPDFEDVNA